MRLVEKKNIVPKYQKSGKFIEPFTEQFNQSYGVDNMSDEQIDQLNDWLYNMHNNLNQSVTDFNTNADNVIQGRKMQINSGLYNYLTKQMIEAGNKAAKETYNKEVIDYYLNNNDDDSRQAINGWKASNNARANAQLPYAKQLDYLFGTKDTYQNNVLEQRNYDNQSIDNGVLLSTILPASVLAAIYKGPSALRHLKNFTKDAGSAYSALFKKGAEGRTARYIMGRTGLDVLGAEAADHAYQNTTGQTWGQTLNQITNGAIKPGLGELLNPMYIMPGAAIRRIEKAYPLVFKNLNPSLTLETARQTGAILPKPPSTWSEKALLFGLVGGAASEYIPESK